eukprot:gnl/TRDRNA2_/TRDRNA2_39187_c0_seq1.p1 gnl/TRDRNA2_/TRDRNA2_39187_c0~~gnl/TRDRNA2_/TRDRNA2_39187_c0_seq1.p1  ORF type:complete len:414 (+),score=76.56 gnl/TRDRNA2_/TRDRNA2_39187_c0_seq1:29-1270(+)
MNTARMIHIHRSSSPWPYAALAMAYLLLSLPAHGFREELAGKRALETRVAVGVGGSRSGAVQIVQPPSEDGVVTPPAALFTALKEAGTYPMKSVAAMASDKAADFLEKVAKKERNAVRLANFFKWEGKMIYKMASLKRFCDESVGSVHLPSLSRGQKAVEVKGSVIVAIGVALVIAAGYGASRYMSNSALRAAQFKWLDIVDRGLVEPMPIDCSGRLHKWFGKSMDNCEVHVQKALDEASDLDEFSKSLAEAEYMRFTLTAFGAATYHKAPGDNIIVKWGNRTDLEESYNMLRISAPEYPADLELSKPAGFAMNAEEVEEKVEEVAKSWKEEGEAPKGLNALVYDDTTKWADHGITAKAPVGLSTMKSQTGLITRSDLYPIEHSTAEGDDDDEDDDDFNPADLEDDAFITQDE